MLSSDGGGDFAISEQSRTIDPAYSLFKNLELSKIGTSMKRKNWSGVIRKIEGSRAQTARFFKPVCIICAIDLTDENAIDPQNIDARKISDRFSDYVEPFFPGRGKSAYQPIWRITNDMLWKFYRDKKLLNNSLFVNGNPGSLSNLQSKFDLMSIADEYLDLWSDNGMRHSLRDAMLLMLSESGNDSQRLVAPLFDAKNLMTPSLWPEKDALGSYIEKIRSQLRLFSNDELAEIYEINDAQSEKILRLAPKNIQNERRLEQLQPVSNIPTPIDYLWMKGKIFAGPSSANLPKFSSEGAEKNHSDFLEVCTVLANNILQDLNRNNWQVRQDYALEIRRYLDRIPTNTTTGNLLLADASARIVREMFESEKNILPYSFAGHLKILLQQHIALRAFYPQIEVLYKIVRTGRIHEPLQLDIVEQISNVVRDQTPALFDISVSEPVDPPHTEIAKNDQDRLSSSDNVVLPPADPLGDIDLTKSRSFMIAARISQLWKAFIEGPKIQSSLDAWINTWGLLKPLVINIISWLKTFLGINN